MALKSHNQRPRTNATAAPIALLCALAVTLTLALTASSPAYAASIGSQIQAENAIVIENSTGDVVYARKPNETRPIASTTKLMTALLAFEKGDLTKRYKIGSYKAKAAESLAGLHAGNRMTMRDLLAAMLLPSGNDAATAIAKAVSGSVPAFVQAMNAKAQAIGLAATFKNPIGLDQAGHKASAYDLVKLTLLLRKYPVFRKIVDSQYETLQSASPKITVRNRNDLVFTTPWVDGVKTGHTLGAGYAVVASGTLNGIAVTSVVLGDPSESARDSDSLALLRYALSQYRVAKTPTTAATLAKVKLKYRGNETVKIAAGKQLSHRIKKGENFKLQVTGLPKELDGPLPKGSPVGTVNVSWRGKRIGSVKAVTATEVKAASIWQKLGALISSPFTPIALVVLSAAAIALLIRRQRRPKEIKRRDRPRTLLDEIQERQRESPPQ